MAGQIWSVDAEGGYMYSDELSHELRMSVQPLQKFRQFCDAKDATTRGYGKELHKGDLYHWDVFSDVATQGGTLNETNSMPETGFTITQGTLSITEYGNSVPYTGKLDDMSLLPVKSVIDQVLKFDAQKAFDIAANAQFNNTPLRVSPVDGTDTAAVVVTENGTAATTNSIALGKDHIQSIVDVMKERNIPPYAMDDYFCISHPTTFRPFKRDLETINQYTDTGVQHIYNGEIGRYEGVRFVEQTFIPKGGADDSTTWDPVTRTADAWDDGQSSWAFFFGADTVAEAMVIPEEMRGKIPQDYGRDRGVAWYYLGGFGLVHFINASQARILKWDSLS